MTGVTSHGIRYPDGATKAKNLGPELQQMAEDIDTFIDTEIDANNPAFRAEAKEAVDVAMGDALLPRITDIGAVRTLSVDHPEWSHVILSYDFRIIGGQLRSGGNATADSGYQTIVVPTGDGTIYLTYDYRRIEPGGEHSSDGLTPQFVLDSWGDRMKAGPGFASLAGWGDSMSTDYSGIGVNQTVALAAKLGVTPFDLGVSADTPYEIAFRMGALDLRITPVGVLPAGVAVAATVNRPQGWRHARSWPCTVMDVNGNVVPVVLTHTAVEPDQTPTWTIQQAGPGNVTIAPSSRVWHAGVPNGAQESPAKFWIGRNDPDPDRTLEALRLMVSQHRDPRGRRLIGPVFNTSSEPSGSPAYAAIMARNAAAAAAFPGDWFDDRRALIDHGLTIAAITPTSADLTAIAEDRIPPSFMLDGLHLNALGRSTLATIDAIEIAGRNW